MQNLRKYIEHMGLFGDSAESSSRTIAPNSLLSWLSVYNLFNIGYHSVHHRFPKIPQDRLAEFLTPKNTFPNYHSAFLDMVRTLRNPQVGVNWTQEVGANTSWPSRLRSASY
jgi:fatty acid desaturase